MVKMKVDMELREYNNKSRKGLYVAVKAPGHKGRVYKYHNWPGEMEIMAEYYVRTVMQLKKPDRKQYNQSMNKMLTGKIYVPKSKKKVTIDKIMKKGIGQGHINNVFTATEEDYILAKRNALKAFINDKQIRQVMATDHNFDKLKNRTEYQIEGYDNKNNKLFTATKFHGRFQEIRNDIKKSLKKGKRLKKDYIEGEMKALGWKSFMRYKEDGAITRVKMTIIIRRG